MGNKQKMQNNKRQKQQIHPQGKKKQDPVLNSPISQEKKTQQSMDAHIQLIFFFFNIYFIGQINYFTMWERLMRN